MILDAQRERAAWLHSFGATEEMVHTEHTGQHLEFIFIRTDEGEALTIVFLPYSVQKINTTLTY